MPVTIRLLQRTYRIRIPQDEEESVRHIIQSIQDRLMEMKKLFPGRDEQDYLAMTLIEYVTTLKSPAAHKVREETQTMLSNLLAQLQE